MNSLYLLVFMDESGKNGDKPMLIGGLSALEDVYESSSVRALTEKIRTTSIHWTNYGGDSKYTVIHYDKPSFRKGKVKFFEWSSSKQLTEVDFNDYLQVFLSTHHELWFGNE